MLVFEATAAALCCRLACSVLAVCVHIVSFFNVIWYHMGTQRSHNEKRLDELCPRPFLIQPIVSHLFSDLRHGGTNPDANSMPGRTWIK